MDLTNDDYVLRFTRWGRKRAQHRLMRRMLEHFDGCETKNIFVIPLHACIAPVVGYLSLDIAKSSVGELRKKKYLH